MFAGTIEFVELSELQLLRLSRDKVLSLSLREMKTMQNYFQKLQRNPTDIEIETTAQTWSEHCKHKTLMSPIEYVFECGSRKDKTRIQNLLKETIFKSAQELNKKWCLSVFKDNAGIIDFDGKYAVCFKVETHNHPSALEPYGGAATGIGGVIRDILAAGLGAKPLANTDVFCFGDINAERSKIPEGISHPRRIMKGVVSGIRDYGNKMGIPTVNGAVCFDEGYTANPLVYCGTMGILPKNKIEKGAKKGDLILLAGGRTGRDGIHGATFSSIQLDSKSDVNAVQIGSPIEEKKLLDALLKARDLNLYTSLTDCGAGGLSSAVGELGKDTGVKVELNKVPLKYEGLEPWEIWVSEAQERMVFSVAPKNRNKILEVFKAEDVEAVFIGEFTDDQKLTIFYNDEMIAELDMDFLHEGVPKTLKTAHYKEPNEVLQKSVKMGSSALLKSLKKVLADLNVCSKEWIIRQYDFEVQGQTAVKPLQGSSIEDSAPSDAAVICPFTVVKGTKKGIVLSNGINPQYGKKNIYKMASCAVEEALRNAAATGANIEKTALLDNFCWGNTNNPEVLGSLVRAAQSCYEASKNFETPFISGKDSLHNEYAVNSQKFSIPPALLISAIGVIDDISKTLTVPFKESGNKVFILGLTRNEIGGSVFAAMQKMQKGIVPQVYYKESKPIMLSLYKATQAGILQACHDISDGGIATAICEMAFASSKGVHIDIDAVSAASDMTPAEILFSESNGRFIVEVKAGDIKKFKQIFTNCIFAEIGSVTDDNKVSFESKKNKISFEESNEVLLNIWRQPMLNV